MAATLAGGTDGEGDRSAVWAVSESQLVAATGLVSDAQVLVAWARQLVLQRGSVYGTPLSTGRLASALAERVHAGTTSSGRRAFATDMLVLGHDAGAHHDVVGLDVAVDEGLLELVVEVAQPLGAAERQGV